MKIYLCGFMGCGKSCIGKLLAKRMGLNFADLDKYIVDAEGKSISDIFKDSGEAHFRTLEAKYIKEMPDNSVVALGGGAIINENTAKVAKENGSVLFLDVPFETCYDRIKDDSGRPIVVNSTKDELIALYNKRKPVYAERSDIIVKAEGSPEAIVSEIKTLLKV